MFDKKTPPVAAGQGHPQYVPTWRDQIALRVMAGFATGADGPNGSAASAAENAYRWADALIAASRPAGH